MKREREKLKFLIGNVRLNKIEFQTAGHWIGKMTRYAIVDTTYPIKKIYSINLRYAGFECYDWLKI